MGRAYPSLLRTLLDEAGISEVTYYTLLRQSSFMRPRRKGQGELPRSNLLALKAFALLRDHGLSNAVAVAAVEAAFPAISEFTDAGKPWPPAERKLGVRLLSLRGKLRMVPLNSETLADADEVGRVELDINGIATLLPPQKNPL